MSSRAEQKPVPEKADCWHDWSTRYTYGQTRDRIHYATARYVALSQSVPTDEAMITRAMMTCFGEGWIVGGRTSLKMIKSVYARNFVTAKGRLREKQHEGDSVRYVFEVWVENEERQKDR